MRGRRIAAGVALALGTLIIAGGLAAVVSGGRHAIASSRTVRQTPPSTTSPPPPGGWHPVAPATTVPEQTPVQQSYDEGFEQGFSSASNRAMMDRADALRLPDPAIGGGWPDLPLSQTPDGWAAEFVAGLLGISFAHRSRDALGAWLVAEEAPDLMPGIPAAFEERALYISLLQPGIVGQQSLLPSPGQWRNDAAAGVSWSAIDLEVQLEPKWQSMIDAGWQPPDIRAAVEDVSGVLTITHRTATTAGGKATTTRRTAMTERRFSVVVQVGSAHWRAGYGTVLVSDWYES